MKKDSLIDEYRITVDAAILGGLFNGGEGGPSSSMVNSHRQPLQVSVLLGLSQGSSTCFVSWRFCIPSRDRKVQ